MNQDQEERQKHLIESSRKQLADGTWPQVMMVWGYKNPRAPRISDEQYACIKEFFLKENCPAMAEFVDLLQFVEKEHNVTMSFNFSMQRRAPPEESGTVPEIIVLSVLHCPDVLVGTRNGIQGAGIWLKNFSEAIPKLPTEAVQIMNKIFSEAVIFIRGSSKVMPFEELLRYALSGEGEIFDPLQTTVQ